MNDEYITPKEAAERKGVSRQTIYSAIARDAIPATRILGRLAVRVADIEFFQPATYGENIRGTIKKGPGRPSKSGGKPRGRAAEGNPATTPEPARCAFITDEGEVFEIPDGPADLGAACAVASEAAFSRFWASPEDEAAWGSS